MTRTLYDLSDLRETGFGRPPPRHGLILLWWFAHECVQIDSNGRMIAQCDPENGAFGFHRFYNKERILPHSNLLYYEVGNLHITDSLPPYVTEKYTRHSDNSNKDRIIVSFNSELKIFDKMYVTQHSDLVRFDKNHTYCISYDLMKNIKNLGRDESLSVVSNTQEQHVRLQSHYETPSNNNSWCARSVSLFMIISLYKYFYNIIP
ncbi:uncharacterized protein LOC125273129 [Megalobrama amblycephala]|uniref:uncharacterized protein LOC125273129 n=1 Tax=Megalobrama amblycephala TaxID=75352 RepID=UPI0020142D55|nr:uncharacterized protein LOC125273129 [Megalobrama amblycephala]